MYRHALSQTTRGTLTPRVLPRSLLLARLQSNLPSMPSPNASFFEIFDIPAQYGVDKADLKKRFLNWQRRVHPDTFAAAGNSAEMEAQAKQWSELINHAYKTLDSDLDRALYMLEQQGMEIEEADGHDDMELLSLILETREALEDAETQESVDSIREQNNVERISTVSRLHNYLDQQAWAQAKLEAIRLRYLNNVEQVCKEWMPGKEIVLQH